MSTINASLPKPRTFIGSLTLVDSSGNLVTGPFACLGKAANDTAAAHNNPTADPTLPYGDTPSGTYSFAGIVATGDGTSYSTHSYGPNGAIKMTPVSGDAATAQANGRTGLMIHGGDLDAAGQLRRTNGCIRLANTDLLSLITAINNLPAADPLTTIVVVDSSVLATQNNGNDDVDEGDPPPIA